MPDASPSISTRFQARDELGCQPPDPTERAVGTPFPPDSSSALRRQNRCEQPYPGRWCETNHRERVHFRTLNGFHSEPFLRTDTSFPWIPPEGPTLGIHHVPEVVASNAKLPSWTCTNASSTQAEVLFSPLTVLRHQRQQSGPGQRAHPSGLPSPKPLPPLAFGPRPSKSDGQSTAEVSSGRTWN